MFYKNMKNPSFREGFKFMSDMLRDQVEASFKFRQSDLFLPDQRRCCFLKGLSSLTGAGASSLGKTFSCSFNFLISSLPSSIFFLKSASIASAFFDLPKKL